MYLARVTNRGLPDVHYSQAPFFKDALRDTAMQLTPRRSPHSSGTHHITPQCNQSQAFTAIFLTPSTIRRSPPSSWTEGCSMRRSSATPSLRCARSSRRRAAGDTVLSEPETSSKLRGAQAQARKQMQSYVCVAFFKFQESRHRLLQTGHAHAYGPAQARHKAANRQL